MELIASFDLDVEPSSILENRFPKELPPGYTSQTSQPPAIEESTVTTGVSGMYQVLRS